MARHRRFGGRFAAQQRAQKAAAGIKVPLPPKPNTKDLKKIYEGVISGDIEVRLKALMSALDWYTDAIDYLEKKSRMDANLAQELQKNLQVLSRATKLRELGINAGNASTAAQKIEYMRERELSCRKSLQQYEKYCVSLNPPPIDDVYKIYDLRAKELEEKAKASQEKYTYLVESLKLAFPNVGLDFKVSPDITGRQYPQPGGAQTMVYGKDIARNMVRTLKREGILKVFSEEMLPIAKSMSVAGDEQNGYYLDHKKQFQVIDKLMKDFVEYCQSQDGPAKIIRKGVFNQPQPVQQQAAAGAAPSQPRAKRVFTPGTGSVKRVGRYKAGSHIGILYARMMDGQEHDMKDLFAGIPRADAGRHSPFGRLIYDQTKYGEHKIEVNGSKVKMTILKP